MLEEFLQKLDEDEGEDDLARYILETIFKELLEKEIGVKGDLEDRLQMGSGILLNGKAR